MARVGRCGKPLKLSLQGTERPTWACSLSTLKAQLEENPKDPQLSAQMHLLASNGIPHPTALAVHISDMTT